MDGNDTPRSSLEGGRQPQVRAGSKAASGRLPDHAEGEACAASAVHSHRPAPQLCVRPDLPPPGDQAAGLRPKPRRTRGTGRVDDRDRAAGARPDVHLECRVVIPGHDRRERHRRDLAVRITPLSQLGRGRGGDHDDPEHARAGNCDQRPHTRDDRPERACGQAASGDDAFAWRFRGSTPRTPRTSRSVSLHTYWSFSITVARGRCRSGREPRPRCASRCRPHPACSDAEPRSSSRDQHVHLRTESGRSRAAGKGVVR